MGDAGERTWASMGKEENVRPMMDMKRPVRKRLAWVNRDDICEQIVGTRRAGVGKLGTDEMEAGQRAVTREMASRLLQ